MLFIYLVLKINISIAFNLLANINYGPRDCVCVWVYTVCLGEVLDRVGLSVKGQSSSDLRLTAERNGERLPADRDAIARTVVMRKLWRKATAVIGAEEVQAEKIAARFSSLTTLQKSMADTLLGTMNRRLRVLEGTPNQSHTAAAASAHARTVKAFSHRLNLHMRHPGVRFWLQVQLDNKFKSLLDKAARTIQEDYGWDDQADNLRVLENITLIELDRYSLSHKRPRLEPVTPLRSAFASPERKEETEGQLFARDQSGCRYRLVPTEGPGQLTDIMIVIPRLGVDDREEDFEASKPDTSVDEEGDDTSMQMMEQGD